MTNGYALGFLVGGIYVGFAFVLAAACVAVRAQPSRARTGWLPLIVLVAWGLGVLAGIGRGVL